MTLSAPVALLILLGLVAVGGAIAVIAAFVATHAFQFVWWLGAVSVRAAVRRSRAGERPTVPGR
ncbi:hypothetical protein ACFXCZ_27315 [Streptomyces sp. NPDC059396]|uniref:hypothetical protein n=1 Tax=Streptomyces sp. NPDC059396 TaxID=3346819 RepID=UPI00369CB701